MKTKLLLVLICIASFSYGQNYSQSWIDVNYAGDGRGYHNLNIYLPAVQQESYPVIIYVYGSAFLSNNSKGTDLSTIGAALLDAGYAVVMPNHRASSDAIYPAQIHDIKAVIRFVRGTAETYKFDTTFIGISGSSSGGQASMLAGTTGGVEDYTVGNVTMNLEGDLGIYTSYNSSVDAVVNWFGPVNLLVLDSCGSSMDNQAANSPASSLVGGPIYENQDRVAFTNPSTFLDPADPPTLIIHGDADEVIPICSSEFYYADLQENGIVCDFIITPGGDHGSRTHIPSNFQAMVSFFNEAKEAKANQSSTFEFTVINGTGSGAFEEGTTVTATANVAPGDKVFSHWIGDGAELLSNVNSPSVSITMPARNVTLEAVFITEPEYYPLHAGWNLIGYPNNETTNIETALSSIWSNLVVIKNMDSFYETSTEPSLNSLTEVVFGLGYFIYVDEDCILSW